MLEGADSGPVFGRPRGADSGLRAHLCELGGEGSTLAIMSTLDDVNITPVQRGDQSRGVVIPGTGGLADAVGGHGRGDGPTGDRGDVPAGSHGGVLAGAPAGTPAPGKHKHARVILDDDEVSSDEGEPLQKRMRQLSGVAGPSGSGPAPAAPGAAPTAAAAADQ
jgi:hypothetical protein